MSNNVFTTKKMNLGKSNKNRPMIIGVVILALVSAVGFGVYQTASSDDSAQRTSKPSRTSSYATSARDSLPSFATRSETSVKNSGPKFSKNGQKKNKKIASDKKKKSKKFASNKKQTKSSRNLASE